MNPFLNPAPAPATTGQAPAPFNVVVRTPLLDDATWLKYRRDAAELVSSGGARDIWHARAICALEMMRRADISEAVYLASQNLHQQRGLLSERDLTGFKAVGLTLAFERYLARMCFRATPFGTFASVRAGSVGTASSSPSDAKRIRRHLQFDFAFLFRQLAQSRVELNDELRVGLNSSTLQGTSAHSYVDWRDGASDGRIYFQSEIDRHPVVDTVVRLCEGHVQTIRSVVQLASLEHPEYSALAIEDAVHQLIRAKLLLPRAPLDSLYHEPGSRSAARSIYVQEPDILRNAFAKLESTQAELNATLDVASYERLVNDIQQMFPGARARQAIRVDSHAAFAEGALAPQVAESVLNCVTTLSKHFAQRDSSLDAFCSEFTERFGDSDVELCRAIELESLASSFERQISSETLLRAGINRTYAGTDTPNGLRKLDRFLLSRLLAKSPTENVIRFTEADLREVPPVEGIFNPAMFAILTPPACGADTGMQPVQLHGVSNRPIGSWVGRFCAGNENLLAVVKKSADQELALDPDAAHAELDYLPAGGMGNILLRPAVWPYRICIVEPCVDPTRDIPLSDLYVSVEGTRVEVRSKRLGRRVVPHMTSAHNVEHPGNIRAYRFLRALETHGRLFCHFGWGGPFLEQARLPRIEYENVVLAPARWTVRNKDVRLDENPHGCNSALRAHLAQLEVSRFVNLKQGDNLLVLDIDDPLDVCQLARALKAASSVVLTELQHAFDAHPARSVARTEVLLPFTLQSSPNQPAQVDVSAAFPRVDASPAPIGEAIYLRLYVPPAKADELLLDVIGPLVDRLRRAGTITKWFFIRYADPGFHIRLRLFPNNPEDFAAVMSDAMRSIESSKRVDRIVISGYQRELQRYGGACLLPSSEELFALDSQSALEQIHESPSDDARWLAAVPALLRMCADSGLTNSQLKQLLSSVTSDYRREFSLTSWHRARIDHVLRTASQFTQLRRDLYSAGGQLGTGREDTITLRQSLFARIRSEVSEPQFLTIFRSHMHMTCNRLMQENSRAYEALIYTALEKLLVTASHRFEKSSALVAEN